MLGPTAARSHSGDLQLRQLFRAPHTAAQATTTTTRSGGLSLALRMLALVLVLGVCGCLCSRLVYSDLSHSAPSTVIPTIPPHLSSTQRLLSAIRVEPNGMCLISLSFASIAMNRMSDSQLGKVSTIQVSKQGLANELGLPLRDLRIVDPSVPKQIRATFITRRKAILFCIENIKVVVRHNKALVFGPYQPEVQEFIPVVQQLISQTSAQEVDWENKSR